jgi:tetratricopeptide (TPR) repeat protein
LAIREESSGQLDKAIEDGLKGLEVVRTSGYWHLFMWASLNNFLGFAYYHKGDLRSDLAIAQETVRYGQDANVPDVLAMGLLDLGSVQERIGDSQESIANLTKAIELSEAIPTHLFRVLSGSFLARCYCRMGDVEKSLSVLSQTDAYRAAHGVRGWQSYLDATLFTTYLAAAEQNRGLQRDEYLRLTKGYPVCLPEATRLQGVYDWLRGKQASAQKHWQRSLAFAEEMGMRYDLGMTHLEIGRRLNDREHLRQAEAVFAEIGAEFDLTETRKLLAEGKK